MAKKDPAARPSRPSRVVDVPKVPTTRTIDLAGVAVGLVVLALWIRALGLLGHQSLLMDYATHYNDALSKPDKNFDAANYAHSLRVTFFISAALVTVILGLLTWGMRRTRSASASRWGVLIMVVLPIAPAGLAFAVVPTWGFPFISQAAGVASGLVAIAVIVLLFLPPSTRYFHECRNAVTPPELRGQPRPGLGSLFRPRPPAGASARTTRPAATRPAKPSASKAKAKVRSDADAIAKGAELARSRAKSSKTRR